jgi:type II secretion system protein J
MPVLIRHNSAFTLLELLVAMALMTIIASSLYASLSIGFKAKESSETAMDMSRSGQITMEILKQEIMAALPPDGLLAGQFKGLDERDDDGNNSDTLTFYSVNHNQIDDETASDIRKIQLALVVPEDSEEQIVVRSITTNLLSPKTPEPVEETICRKVRALNFRYFDGYEWQDGWDSIDNDDSLPQAVEITIKLGEKDDPEEMEYEDSYSLIHSFIMPCGSTV